MRNRNLFMLNDGDGGGHHYQDREVKPKQPKSKFKLNLWYGLSIRIIALFATAMLVSFTPELLRGFFGDTLIPQDGHYHRKGMIDCEWDWEYRHYLYFLMCFCLFCVQAVRLIMWVDENKDEFKP